MLDLRRLRLLRELHARGTIAAVADALQYTPSAVSQQLAVLEREAGVPLLERAGRGVRLTDAALVLVDHAGALLERAELAEAELAAGAASVVGRGRIATFQSAALRIAVPAMAALAREAPGLRCELVEAEPEQALPELALGGVDLVLADEWQHQPRPRPPGVDRHELYGDTVRVVLPEAHPARAPAPRPGRARRAARRDLGDRPRRHGVGARWRRTCRELGGFDPDVRHRTNDASSASPSSPRARRSRCCPTWCRPTPARASSCARSPAARCTARSSPPPGARTRRAVRAGAARRRARRGAQRRCRRSRSRSSWWVMSRRMPARMSGCRRRGAPSSRSSVWVKRVLSAPSAWRW